MKIMLAQINTTPADFEGNMAKIIHGIKEASRLDVKADVIVFPELAICGYSSRDMFHAEEFIDLNLRYLNDIAHMTAGNGLTVIVGYAGYNTKGHGKPFTNMAAVIREGAIISTYQKHLLPNYDVFDERRYFESGTDLCIVTIAGVKCGISICEDIWNDKGQEDYSYEDNPIARYRARGVKTFINLSSSPFVIGKPERRMRMLNKISEDDCAVIYVNQCGAQDELVFDGRSCVMINGANRYIAPSNHGESIYPVVDMKRGYGEPIEPFNQMDELYDTLITGIRDYFTKTKHAHAVLGSSGGIDSAVVAALASAAIGAKNVTCIMMPSCYSSEDSTVHAEKLHKNLGCNELTMPIEHMSMLNNMRAVLDLPQNYEPSADENIQARLRGMVIMFYANAMKALALTTGNKTELAFGYCTLYGDMNGGLNCLGGLYKREVFALAEYVNGLARKEIIPRSIIYKAPSAELKPDQTDEASLLPYSILDFIAEAFIEKNISTFDTFVAWAKTKCVTGYRSGNGLLQYWVAHNREALAQHLIDCKIKDPEKSTLLIPPMVQYNKLIRLIKLMEFKRRQAAPCIKVHQIDFGTGRRLPIVQGG